MTRALVVTRGDEFARIALAASRHGDVRTTVVRDLIEASAALAEEGADAIVLDADGPGALALAPLVRSLCEGIFVVAVVDPADADVVRAAIDLDVDALVSSPLTGDGLLRAFAKSKAVEREARSPRAEGGPSPDLGAPPELASGGAIDLTRRTTRELRRVVDAAMLGQEDLVAAALDAIAEVAPTVTASVDLRPPGEPITAASSGVPRLVLGEEGREVGAIELRGGTADDREVALQIAGVLSSLLALLARLGERPASRDMSRVLDKRQFDDVLTREIDKARRHRRSLSVLSIDVANVDPELLSCHLRASDAVGQSHREVLVLLPETGSIGAARLRRRVTRAPAGSASLPRDGMTRDALVRKARARREEMAQSPLTTHVTRKTTEGPRTLVDLLDELLSRPLLHEGGLAVYPLVLALPAAVSMFRHACAESVRRRESFVDVAGPEAVVSAVRDVEREGPGSLGVLEHQATRGLFALVLTSELGTWACAGRVEGDAVTAIHGADPLLGDLVVQALETS